MLKNTKSQISIAIIQIIFFISIPFGFSQFNSKNSSDINYASTTDEVWIIGVDQIDFINPFELDNSTTGLLTIQYNLELGEQIQYMNIIAQSYLPPHNDVWIGQNIALNPFENPTNLTYAIDFSLLGAESGENVIEIIMAFAVTDTMQMSQPTLPNDNFYYYVVGDISYNVGEGFEIPDLEPEGDITSFEHDWALATDSTWIYRGCHVPNIDLDDSQYPATFDYDNMMYTYLGDFNACALAACTNSLDWLESQHEEIDSELDSRQKMDLLDEIMERELGDNFGVSDESYIEGILDLIDSLQLPISVKFQSYGITDPTIPSPNSKYGHSAANQGVATTQPAANQVSWNWIESEMEAGEDVTLSLQVWSGTEWESGHMVVLTGISKDDNNKKMTFKDDIDQSGPGGTQETQVDVSVVNGWLVTNRLPGNPRNEIIAGAFSKSYDPNVTFEGTGIFNGNYSTVEQMIYIRNYPNPFNSTTTFRFYLEKSSNISLIVYNLLGQKIQNIIEGQYPVGNHEVKWEANNLSSGIYLYQFKADQFHKIKKLIIQN